MSDSLSELEKTAVTAVADQFRHALAGGGVTDWEPYLAGASPQVRRSVLTELIVIELGHRWTRGERATVEEYVSRYPELATGGKIPAVIVVEEHKCRIRAGERPTLDEYRARFPKLFPELQSEIESAGVSWTIADTSARRWEPMPEGLVAASQQYELVRELGRGMFGEVWLARKKPSGIEKAIKILLQSADRDSAQREQQALELIKNLRHPYLLATEDFWVANNRLHIVMELAEGTLRGRLKYHKDHGQPGIPADELFRYIAEAAEGLDFLHEKHITHRDIKPDNILIMRGHAKLADFGLVREQEQRIESMSLAGTPVYMAPEVWGGEGGPASDLYSLAFAYTELRQGRSPLRQRSMSELMAAHQKGTFEFEEVVTEAEREVLRRAMSVRPEDRHPTCTAFAADLARALGVPFAGGGAGIARGSNPSIEDVFGSGTIASRADLPNTDTINDNRRSATLIIGPPDEQIERQPRWRPIALTATLAAVPVLLAVVVWLVFFNNGKTQPTKPGGNGNSGEPALVVPAGATPEEGAAEVELIGKKAPEWVFVERGGERVRFRLITGNPGPYVEPFYISEAKVTVKLFRAAVGRNPPPQPEGTVEAAPVMNVPADEARTVAQALGGDLPSADQWDHAAGLFDQRGQHGPALPPGRGWVGKPAPGPVRREGSEVDVNRFGLIDMSGNGREWTRTVIAPRGTSQRDWASGPLGPGEKLILRGRIYTTKEPLTFAELDFERKSQPQAASPVAGSPYTGFRVVLSLP